VTGGLVALMVVLVARVTALLASRVTTMTAQRFSYRVSFSVPISVRGSGWQDCADHRTHVARPWPNTSATPILGDTT
jgi:hypothetical protein